MTVATAADPRAVDAYASAVARHLRHLPRAQRRRLVADLRAHLLEVPGGSDLASILGGPRAYADELLRSSGLPQPHGIRAWLRRVPLWVRVAVPVFVVLAVVAVIGGIWISGYQPLVNGGWSEVSGTQPDSVFGDQANVVVEYQHDARYQFGFSLLNTGSFPVQIVDFPLAWYTTTPLVVEQVLVEPPNSFGTGRAVPFRPVTLQPGEDRGFVFRGVLANCSGWDGGGSLVYQTLTVDYRVLGIAKTGSIPLSRPIAVHMPGTETAQCPYPRPPREGPLDGIGTQILDVPHGGSAVEVQVIASRAPTGDLHGGDWTPSAACDDTPPAGSAAVPVDIVVSHRSDLYHRSPVPIDLGLATSAGRVLVAAGGMSHRCRLADSVHVESLDEGDIAVVHGMVEVPAGTCGAQQVSVSVVQPDGGLPAGAVRLDIPCPAGG